MSRTKWIDSCRFLAIFVIMLTHYLAKFCPDSLSLWEEGISSLFLYGLTGKFSVAFFFVLLGYFASKPIVFNSSSFVSYIVQRYLQFAFYIFITSCIYVVSSYGVTWLFHTPDNNVFRILSDGFKYNIIYILRDSLMFEDNYNPTLWCMQQLFAASFLCKCFAFLPQALKPVYRLASAFAIIFALMLINSSYNVWICASVLGYVLRVTLEVQDKRGIEHCSHTLLFLLFTTVLVLIKIRMPESVLQYSMQSFAAFLLIYINFNFSPLKAILSRSPLPWLGGISMGLFVVHSPVNDILYSSLYPVLTAFVPGFVTNTACFILSLTLSVLSAWLLHSLYSLLQKKILKSPVNA